MNETTVYFIDDDPGQRDNTGWALRTIFREDRLLFEVLAPLRSLDMYTPMLLGQVAFLVDEKLRITGEVDYDGHQLATYLRGVRPEIPIFIITAFEPESVPIQSQPDVEAIVGKSETTPNKPDAERFRARFLRAVGAYETALSNGARRVHELIVKSVGESLTPDEIEELNGLELRRQAPVSAMERSGTQNLSDEIEQLKRALSKLDQQSVNAT